MNSRATFFANHKIVASDVLGVFRSQVGRVAGTIVLPVGDLPIGKYLLATDSGRTTECLDHFVVLGEAHLRHHEERPHH